MPFDAHKNLAVSLVATAPSPATSGTTLVVTAGDGARFPAAPFNATVWPANQVPTPLSAEIVRVTARTNDTLTLVRAQEATTARAIVVGDVFAHTMTVKTFTDLESGLNFPQIATGQITGTNLWLSANQMFVAGTTNQISRADNTGSLFVIGGTGGGTAAFFGLYGNSHATAPGLMEFSGNKITFVAGGAFRQVLHGSGGISFGGSADPGPSTYNFAAASGQATLVLESPAGTIAAFLYRQTTNGTVWYVQTQSTATPDLQWYGKDGGLKLSLTQTGNLDAAGTVTMRALTLRGDTGTVTLAADTLTALLDRVAALEAKLSEGT